MKIFKKILIQLTCVLGISLMLPSLAVEPAPTSSSATGALPTVQSANIMDVDTRSDAQAQREREIQQPGNSAPFWRAVNSDTAHYVSIPNKEAGVLILKSGEQWRLFRNGVITVFGGWLIVLVVSAITIFYFFKGPIKLEHPRTGKKIERFTAVERLAHWTMAYSFIALAITGLFILFGKHLVLPIIGSYLYGLILFLFKNVHNLVGPLFTVSVLVFFVMFVKDNIPGPSDWAWIKSMGGARGHAAAGRFNFGEKMWFWIGMTTLGLIVSASGWVLDMIVPGLDYWRGTMQLANIIHGIAAVLIMVFAMGHIYIGTIGTEGAIDGMKTGYVDEAWARQHHSTWLEDIESGKIPESREPEKSATTDLAKKILRSTT